MQRPIRNNSPFKDKQMKTTLFLLAAALVCASTFAAAEDLCEAQVQHARTDSDPVRALKAVLDVRLQPACVSELLLRRRGAHLRAAILVAAYKQLTQNVQQNGSSNGSGGSTNLVSKSLTSRVLSLASEYGALTQTSSGQTTTVSGTIDGIPLALQRRSEDLFAECPLNLIGKTCIRSGVLDFLSRISYSVAFNTTQASQLKGTATGSVQGTTQPVNVQSSGSAGTVSQVTGKVVIFQHRVSPDDLSKALKALDPNSALAQAADAQKAAAKTLRTYQTNAGLTWSDWQEATAQHLAATPPADVVQEWLNQGGSLATVLENSGAQDIRPTEDDVTQAALTFASSFAEYGAAERSFFETSLVTPALSFEYDENRPTSQPSNSVFRFIYNQTVKGWTLTGNAAASIYDSTPSSSIPGAQRLRDIQVAFEGDHPLPKWGPLGTPTFSAAYYFQDQTSPAILNVTPSGPVSGVTFSGLSSNATQVFAQKGKISIGQLRISFGSSKSGLRFPIAITGSNRTELITASKLGGQIGISYDFDSLFTK
jgi:hypothetical protein